MSEPCHPENHGFFSCSSPPPSSASASPAVSSSPSSLPPLFCKPIKISQPDVVCGAILRLYQTRKHSDVVFVVGADRMTFPAHQLILAAHSPVFDSLFFDDNDSVFPTSPKSPYKDQQRRPITSFSPTSSPPLSASSELFPSLFQMAESLTLATKLPVDKYNITAARSASPVMSKAKTVRLSDVESDVFAAFLQYLYSGEVFIDTALATPLLGLASNFQVKSLKQKCGEYVAKSISAETVVRFLEDSVAHDTPALYDKCFQFILENFVDVVGTKQFREDFSEAQLKKILQSGEVNASELCIFAGLVRWGICQVEMRPVEFEQVGLQQVLSNLLKHVRWDLMTPEEIVDVVRPIGIAPVEDLFEALASRHSTQNGPPANSRKGSFLPTSEEVIESLQAELLKFQSDLPQSPSSKSAGEPPLPNNVYSPPRTATLNIDKRVQNLSGKANLSLPPTFESDSSSYTDDTERSFHSPRKERKRSDKRLMKDMAPDLPVGNGSSAKKGMPGALNQSHKSSSWASGRKRSDSAEGKPITTNQWDQVALDQNEHTTLSSPKSTELSPHGILPPQAALSVDDGIEEELPSRKSPKGKTKKKKESKKNQSERQKKTYSNEGVSFRNLSPEPPNGSRPMSISPKAEGKKKRRGSQINDREKYRVSRKRTSNFNSP